MISTLNRDPTWDYDTYNAIGYGYKLTTNKAPPTLQVVSSGSGPRAMVMKVAEPGV